jgi:UDP-N-acetylmuramoylalanine--D-glutamate ligase
MPQGTLVADGTSIRRLAEGGTGVDCGSLDGIGSLRGAHNMQNALAVMAIAGVVAPSAAPARIIDAFRSFPGLAHRLQQVARIGKVLFVNDSKATNADSAEKALASFDRDIYWIAGGRPKEGGITSLAGAFPRIVHAYLIGEAAGAFAETLAGRVPVTLPGTLDAAVAAAAADAAASGRPEPVVLLSPACASFDQFPDFEARGRAFVAAVERLATAKAG